MSIADRIAQGESSEEARRRAREFGNPLLVRETTRRMWSANGSSVSSRTSTTPGARCDALLPSPSPSSPPSRSASAPHLPCSPSSSASSSRVLPYQDAHRLVTIYESGRRGNQPHVPWLDIQQWSSNARSFESIGFYRAANGRSFLEGDNGAQQVSHQLVSTNQLQRSVRLRLQDATGPLLQSGRHRRLAGRRRHQPRVVKQYSQSNDPDKVMGQSLMGFGKDRRAIVVGILDDTSQVSVADQPAPEIQGLLPATHPRHRYLRWPVASPCPSPFEPAATPPPSSPNCALS